MKLTLRQKRLLAVLPRITLRQKKGGRQGYFLAREDCSATINSLIVKGAIVRRRDQLIASETAAMPQSRALAT